MEYRKPNTESNDKPATPGALTRNDFLATRGNSHSHIDNHAESFHSTKDKTPTRDFPVVEEQASWNLYEESLLSDRWLEHKYSN